MAVIPIQASSGVDVVKRYQSGTLSLGSIPPLSIYVHVPWCIKKCPYCDFNSHEARQTVDQGRYVAALMHDLESALPEIWGRSVQTVFIGGGTPSLFAPESIAELISGLRARVKLAPDAEITLEANPGTFERDRFVAYAQAGVTRLSMGIQSFNDIHLKALGRIHDGAQARAAIEEAQRAFRTFNIDLMYALPGQSLEQFQQDLQTALDFSPPHLSVYHLTIEPNTLFATRPPSNLPDDDTAYGMLDAITEATQTRGLHRYEVSAFAQAGHACRHNLNYWQFGDYLGIGAGAHGKVSFAHQIVRQTRVRDPQRYLEAANAGQSTLTLDRAIAREDLPFEYMMNALRLTDGFALSEFGERTGLPISAIRCALDQAESQGLIEQSLHHVKPTARGLDFLNDLQAIFLPA